MKPLQCSAPPSHLLLITLHNNHAVSPLLFQTFHCFGFTIFSTPINFLKASDYNFLCFYNQQRKKKRDAIFMIFKVPMDVWISSLFFLMGFLTFSRRFYISLFNHIEAFEILFFVVPLLLFFVARWWFIIALTTPKEA